MMKKGKGKFFIFASSMILSLLVILAGCSDDKDSSGSVNPEKGKGKDQEVFKLNLNSVYPNSTLGGINFLGPEFIEEVKERSNGRLVINGFYSGELVPQSEMLNALASNTIDLGISSPVFFGDAVPTGMVSLVPYWSKSITDAHELYRETIVGELFEKEMEEKGVKVLAYAVGGSYGFALNKPIEKYEDISKLLLRSAGWGTDIWYKEMGVSGAPIPSADVYDALQRGIVDGTPWSFAELESQKYGEVIDYILEPAFVNGGPLPLYISMDSWNKLPEDLQEIITEVALEMEKKALEYTLKNEKTIPQQLEKYDIEVIELPEKDQQKLHDSSQVVWDEFAKFNDSTAKIAEFLREKNGMK